LSVRVCVMQEKAALKKLENVRSDHAKRLDDLEKEQTTDMHKAQLIEVNLSLVISMCTLHLQTRLFWDTPRPNRECGWHSIGSIHMQDPIRD